MEATFSASGSNILLDFYQSASTLTVPFSDFQNKWHFLGLYKEDSNGGYSYDGMWEESSTTLSVPVIATFSLNVGAASGGTNSYLGVMARFSIHERESVDEFRNSEWHIQEMLM